MKICLKCKRGLFDRDTKCDQCGCTDIMDKTIYTQLCDKFKNASPKEQDKLRQTDEYTIICKYKFIIDTKNTVEMRQAQSISDKEKSKHREEVQKRELNKVAALNTTPQRSNQVSCPYCKSTNVRKIGIVSRGVSVGLFGLASKKIGKQWHCNQCKSDF